MGFGWVPGPFGTAHFSIKFVEIRKNALGTHDNVFVEQIFVFFKKNNIQFLFFRFSKFIIKKLGFGWCRRPFGSASRTLPDAEKNSKSVQKCSWRPTGSVKKSQKRCGGTTADRCPVTQANTSKIDDSGISVHEIRSSCYRGVYKDFVFVKFASNFCKIANQTKKVQRF